MKREEALIWVQERIEKDLGIPKDDIQEEKLLMQDFGMSSVDIMRIVSLMEEETHIPVSVKAIRSFIRVRNMVDYLESM